MSIKRRLAGSYLLIIFLTVFIFELFLILFVRQYYLGNIQETLKKHAEVTGNFYYRYLSDIDLSTNAKSLQESLSSNTEAQVQIINSDRKLIGDSLNPNVEGEIIDNPDVRISLKGKSGVWKGTIPVTNEPVMSVTYPLKSGDKVLGVLRLVTSLKGAYAVIQRIIFILVSAGLVILFAVAIISNLLSYTITGPIKDITIIAVEMAGGRFTARLHKKYNDEIGKLADTLDYMAGEIVRHERLKNNFIASISHELRTPLTSIKGWAFALGSGAADSEGEFKEGLAIIEKESDRLTLLVEELLDFSKFTAGKITLSINQINLNELLEYVVKQMIPRALRQNIKLLLNTDIDICIIEADGNRLKQVFVNLLDNALKFTPPGGTVAVSTGTVENHVKISLEDTGIGIPADELPMVTRMFYKGDGKAPGSGLGLAISDEIIKLHNGRLDIYSIQGQGTKVVVTLPL